MKSFKSFSQEISQQPLEEKNKPTSPEKWARAKAAAKSKFDIYPSAYANAWAAKKYKSMGGGWRSTNEDSSLDEKKNVMDYEEPHMTKNQLRSLIYHTNDLLKMLSDDPELPEWVEAKRSIKPLRKYICATYAAKNAKITFRTLNQNECKNIGV